MRVPCPQLEAISSAGCSKYAKRIRVRTPRNRNYTDIELRSEEDKSSGSILKLNYYNKELRKKSRGGVCMISDLDSIEEENSRVRKSTLKMYFKSQTVDSRSELTKQEKN